MKTQNSAVNTCPSVGQQCTALRNSRQVANTCQRRIKHSTPETYLDRRKRTVEVANGPPPQKPHLARQAKIRPANTVPPSSARFVFTTRQQQPYTRHFWFPIVLALTSSPESFDNTVAPAFSAPFLASCHSIYIHRPNSCSCL